MSGDLSSIIEGGPSGAERDRPHDAIGNLLVEGGHLTQGQLEQVLTEQKRKRRRFGEIAVKLGFTKQAEVDSVLARQYGYPMLRKGASNARLPEGLVTAQNPSLPFAESMRALRSQLVQRWFDGQAGHSAMALASVDRGDGKSFICANLAVVFSQLGTATLVIDADLREPTQQSLFGLRNRMGLSGLLSGRASLSEVRRMRSMPNLSVLPAGPRPPNPQELLGSRAFARLLKEMASHFDVILIDTPAAQVASDVQVVAARAGSALLVARRDKTRGPELARLSGSLASAGTQILGSTLNDY